MTHKDGITAALLFCFAFALALAALVGEPFQGVGARLCLLALAVLCYAMVGRAQWPRASDERWHWNRQRGRLE